MKIELKYEPRSAFGDFHLRENRWALLVAHRRAGKTVACINDLVVRALRTKKKNARYGYVAPFRSQAKAVAWTYLKEACEEFAVKIRESDLRVELPNGAWISLYGADNPDSLRGLYFDGLILDEFADMRPALWGEVILPTLADRKGWVVIIGTPKGHNLFYEFHKKAQESDDWFHLVLRASDSGLIEQKELEGLRSIMTEAQYNQEMECSFEAPVIGTYFADIIERMEISGQIKDKGLYDDAFPVFAVSDIGYSDSCAWWFWQHRPDGIAIIDYYENHSKGLPHYLGYLDSTNYEFDTIYLPHDAKAKTFQTGRSTVEQVIDHYRGSPVKLDIVPRLAKQHSIDAARLVLPRCHVDSIRCGDGINALRAYRRRYNETLKKFADEPLHDWASNGSDAFQYLSLVAKDRLNIKLPHEAINQIDDKKLTYSFNLEMLFADREQAQSRWNRRI